MFLIPILVSMAKYSCKGEQSLAIVTFSINEFHSFVGFLTTTPFKRVIKEVDISRIV